MVRHLVGQRLTVVEGAVEGLRLFLSVDVMCVDTQVGGGDAEDGGLAVSRKCKHDGG